MIERRYCSVCDGYCLVPAGLLCGAGMADGDASCKETCRVCGEPVCKNCSLLVNIGGRRKRVCHTCVERHDGNADRIMAHLEELAKVK